MGMSTMAMPQDSQPAVKVIVLGAGAAGLACAQELKQAGFEVRS